MEKITAAPLKIPTWTLPENWRQLGADKFNLAISTVEKIVYGLRNNDEVFKYMLELAESEKERRDEEQKHLAARLQNLTK